MVGTLRVDPEFEHPARGPVGAGQGAVTFHLAWVANVDDEVCRVVEPGRHLLDAERGNTGVGLGDEGDRTADEGISGFSGSSATLAPPEQGGAPRQGGVLLRSRRKPLLSTRCRAMVGTAAGTSQTHGMPDIGRERAVVVAYSGMPWCRARWTCTINKGEGT